MKLEEFVYLNKLYSIYKNILTEKQKQILSCLLDEDYSITEISEVMNISRQAVHDTIKRSEQLLLDYENKLGILENDEKITNKINNIYHLISENEFMDEKTKSKVLEICKEML